MELVQVSTVRELYLPDTPAVAGGLAYLLPRGTTNPPASISFENSWTTCDGAYLLLSQPVATGSEGAFAAAAWAYLQDRRLAGTRFAWLDVTPDGGLVSGPAIQAADQVTAFAATLPLVSLAVVAPAGTAVAQDVAGAAFTFTGGLAMTSRWGAATAGSIASALTLPLTGPLAGCLQFALNLSTAELDAVDAGLRWFYAIPDDAGVDGSAFFLGSLRFPLLANGVELYANLDPLAPLDAARSFLAFAGADAGQPSAPAPGPVGSHLRTTLGAAVTLQPLTGPAAPSAFAALVLASNPQASTPSPRDAVYLVPRGDFALADPDVHGSDVMCGLSGVEYVELAAAGNILSFFPGAAAFATGFEPNQPAGCTKLQPATAPTTSSASVTARDQTMTYYAQPDQSILYNYGALEAARFTALSPVPVQAGGIAWPPTPQQAFPLLPYAGVIDDDLAPYGQLEAQVVSPCRRKLIAESGTQPSLAGRAAGAGLSSPLSTTPQGLLAAYVPGASTWDQVILAKMYSGDQLILNGVSGELLTAFQSNKLFLVATRRDSVALGADDSTIVIGSDAKETWKFDLDPASWIDDGVNKTILILKFHDLAIDKLVADTGPWASAAHFNDNPATVSAYLVDAINRIDPTDADFADFLAAVSEPSWNGVLALNVKTPVQQLPSELAGLAVGIDQSKFYAHHIGIAASKIDTSAPTLAITDSSAFGLLNYVAPEPLPPDAGDYAFQVEQLKVLFRASAVAGFSSVIELAINRLFGEPATLEPVTATGNVVKLYGVYQKHVVGGQVVESYTFQTGQGARSVFAVTSTVLNAVVLSKGQFVTLTGQDSSSETVSQFLFWGQLDFHELPFDAFSFGRASASDPAAGLSFGNLIVGMSFDPADSAPVATFEFDAGQLTLDVATSALPREHSLYAHFPLTVAGLTQGKTGTTPDGLGYMGVQTPLTQSTVGYPWFGLNYDLDLGSPGALAAEAGFVASFTVAWSPGRSGDYTVFTGLKLPGSSGSKREISIEGIFDITFRTIAILAPEPDTFVLVLFGIGLEFLSFTFPPSGQVNFVLFGDPGATGPGDTTLGWYAAYAKPDSASSPSAPTAQLAPAPSPLLLEPRGPR